MKTSFQLAAVAAVMALAVSVAEARSVPYVYPKQNAKVTVHYTEADPAYPANAVTYQGQKGMYLVTWDDFFRIHIDVEEEQRVYNVWSFTPDSLEHRADNNASPAGWAFKTPAIVEGLERVLSELVKKGKAEAPQELEARIKKDLAAARSAETRRKALEALEAAMPGSLKDKAYLSSLEKDIETAASKVEKVRAAAPKRDAEYFWSMGLGLEQAEKDLAQVGNVLDWLPK